MLVELCVAVIIEEPVPTIVTVLPDIVATDSSLLVYVKAPLLLEVGADSVNGASPKFLGGTVKLDNVGIFFTTLYTRTCPAFEPLPALLKGAPIATVFPSDERHYFEPLTLYYTSYR